MLKVATELHRLLNSNRIDPGAVEVRITLPNVVALVAFSEAVRDELDKAGKHSAPASPGRIERFEMDGIRFELSVRRAT